MNTPPNHEAVEAAMKYAQGSRKHDELSTLYSEETTTFCEVANVSARILSAEIERLRAELAKLADPVAVHINMLRGTIAIPSREHMEHVWHGAPPCPEYPDRPDRPGWWWNWNHYRKEWRCWTVSKPESEDKGKWLPATPPPAPKEEKETA
jgi:uncharacterized small protein (DUF1192 family)